MTTEETTIEQQVNTEVNPFAEESWREEPRSIMEEQKVVEDEVKVDDKKQEESSAAATPAELKTYLGYDSWDAAKAEIESLRKLKETPATPAEISFANDESKKIYEALKGGKEDDVYEVLALKKQLTKAEQLDVTNVEQASELIKLSLSLNHRDLEPFEIADLFQEQYSKPEKPKQAIEQTDEEYEQAVNEWKSRCEAIDRKIVRDAKLAKPGITQKKSEIVLPDIPKQEDSKTKEPTQEELAAQQKFKESYLQSVTATIGELKGFSAQVKDKDVDFTVSYSPSAEEKTTIEAQLKSFAENGFNANALFVERWMNKDGTLNSNQIAEDMSLLVSKDKVLQKVALDAANKRLQLYLKEKKNINVNETSSTGRFSPSDNGKNETEQMGDFFFSH